MGTVGDDSGFGPRKFSINRNTGVPRPARRFSTAEPGLSGMFSSHETCIIPCILVILNADHLSCSSVQRPPARSIASSEPLTRGTCDER